VADHHHAAAIDARQAADDGGVVGECAVAGEFVEFVADQPQGIERVRPRRMAGELRDLPLGEVAEDLAGACPQLFLEPVDFLVDVDRRPVTGVAQLLDLGFQFGDGLFEIEEIGIHARIDVRQDWRET
jgi:hypothetical protein